MAAIAIIVFIFLLKIRRKVRAKDPHEPIVPPVKKIIHINLPSKNRMFSPIEGASGESGINEAKELNRYKTENNILKTRVDSLKADLFHWKQRSIRAEEVNEQKQNELTSVYKANKDYNETAVALMLSFVADAHDIEDAVKARKIPRTSQATQLGSVILVALGIAILYLNPEILRNIVAFLEIPRNQLYIIAGLIITGIVVFYWKRMRKKR